jgi:hypothetical protein
MRNRILSLTRNTIPYVKEVMPLAGSVTGCILMQQLDYWFERYPDGFYKFQDPAPGHPMYKEGESWTEELGFTLTEFRGAFDRIGVRHKSKSDWTAADDKFQGKFYCCFTDRRAGVTYYFRNHAAMDTALDAIVSRQERAPAPQAGPGGVPTRAPNWQKPPVLPQKQPANAVNQETSSTGNEVSSFTANEQTQFTGNGETQLTGNAEIPSTGDAFTVAAGVSKGNPQEVTKGHTAYTETTVSEITKQQLQQPDGSHVDNIGKVEERSSCDFSVLENLVYPTGMLPAEKTALLKLLGDCPADSRQAVLDEVEGARMKKTLRTGIVPFARHLILATHTGDFTPSLGVAVLAGREHCIAQTRVLESTVTTPPSRAPSDYSDEEIAALPSVALRDRMTKLKREHMANGRTT